jgi:hypothetical protein
MDDTQRHGERKTIEMLSKILQENNKKFLVKDYIGEKNHHSIICSDNLKFLTSLR